LADSVAADGFVASAFEVAAADGLLAAAALVGDGAGGAAARGAAFVGFTSASVPKMLFPTCMAPPRLCIADWISKSQGHVKRVAQDSQRSKSKR